MNKNNIGMEIDGYFIVFDKIIWVSPISKENMFAIRFVDGSEKEFNNLFFCKHYEVLKGLEKNIV
jgi:hypothetical protein